jgi:nucleotide-binding universal stress UspA family protein
MFDHFIVPVDLSDRNTPAVRTSCELARSGKGFVTLLHVVETLDLPYEEVSEFYDRLETRAASRLDEISRPLVDADVEFEQLVVFGDPAEEIVQFASQAPKSLIVLQSHRVDPAHPTVGWATLSYKIAILAESPILLVKRDPTEA